MEAAALWVAREAGKFLLHFANFCVEALAFLFKVFAGAPAVYRVRRHAVLLLTALEGQVVVELVLVEAVECELLKFDGARLVLVS